MSGAGKYYQIQPWVRNAIPYNEFPWEELSGNPHDAAMDWMKTHPENIRWDILTDQNEEVVDLLKKVNLFTVAGPLFHFTNKSKESIVAYMGKEYALEEMYSDLSSMESDTIMDYLAEYPTLIEPSLSANRHMKAIALLKRYPELINWIYLSTNSSAMELLLEHEDEICWDSFCANPADQALDLLELTPEKIDWHYLAINTNTRAIQMLEKKKMLDPTFRLPLWLSSNTNPAAMALLEKYPENIYIVNLCKNPTDAAMMLLQKQKHSIHLPTYLMSILRNRNPLALKLVEECCTNENGNITLNMLQAQQLLHNPHIFEYNYPSIREDKKHLHNDLMAYLFHPKNAAKFKLYQLYDNDD